MSFRFGIVSQRRRPSLTPMIDVVFLLLVFFMLAARFGQLGALDLRIAGAGAAEWPGPPRLITVLPDGQQLNGVALEDDTLVARLGELTATTSDPVLLTAAEDVDLQRLLDVMARLTSAGFTNLALVAQ